MKEQTYRDGSSGVLWRRGTLTRPLLLVAALVALGAISLLALGGREAGAQTVGPEKAGGVTGWGAQQNVGLTSAPGGFSGAVAIAGGGRHGMVLQDDGRVVAWGNGSSGQTTVPTQAQSGVKAIAGGSLHSLALKEDGSVVAWGNNDNGQGNIPTEAQSGVKAISAGFFHNLALNNDGKVTAWGYNGGVGGDAGFGGQTNVPATAQSGVTAIAAGREHSLALKNGGVIGWGDDWFGQLSGVGTRVPCSTPCARTVPLAAQSGVKAIAAGYDHSLALKNDGSVVAWGRNDNECTMVTLNTCQEPRGGGQINVPAAARSGVVAIAGGGYHSMALKADGSVVAWGYNGYGQTDVPTEAQSGVRAIAAGQYYSMALKEDGTVLAWGRNDYRQTQVPVSAQSGVVAVAAGSENNLALREDGRVAAWGSNKYAPDGPNDVPRGALSGVAAIDAGRFHGMALKNGGVIAWGVNSDGVTNVPASAQSGVKAIAAGDEHSLALKDNDDSVVAWGNNDSGQTTVPTAAQSGVKAIAGGGYHSMALKEDGSVVAWGSGGLGQTNVPAAAQSGVKAIAAGQYHSMALREDGRVVEWGYNAYGLTNVPAAAQSGVVAIDAGQYHSLAVKADGTVVAWGRTDFGQANVPGGLSGVVAVSGGSTHSLAIVDSTAPAPVDNFAADSTVGDGRVSLSWKNPSTPDFKAVRVLRSTTAHATSHVPNAGQVQVYEGSSESFTDTGLTGSTTYYYTIYARDGFGNFSVNKTATATPNDATAPNTTITGGPSGTVNSAFATFTFTSSENNSTFECRLDGAGEFTSCASGIAYTNLTDGSHTFEVRAKDATGNIDASPASRTWTVDTAVPDTTLTGGPSGTVKVASATFDFTSPEDGATFECKLDGGAFATCQSGKTYQNLSDGSHTFSVRAKDAAGNIDDTPESRTWSVDTTAPNTTLTSGPTGSVKSTTATFGFSSEAGASFECKLDGGEFAACQTGQTYQNLSDTSHTFEVRATDAAGNTDASPASRTWTVDTAVPDTTLTSGPTGSVKSTTATFDFNSPEDGATFECKLDGEAFATCQTGKTYTGLSDISHTFEVRAKDAAGNIDDTPESRTWTVDTFEVVAWGSNTTSGQTTGQRTVPTTALYDVKAISAGTSFNLALKDNGTVVGWGLNTFGQTTIPTGLSGVEAIAAGGSHSLALKDNGTVVGWGLNTSRQTDVPTTAQSGVEAIAAGGSHSLALKDGSVVAWGNNGSGQINVPDTAKSGVKAIEAGGNFSLALKEDGSVVAWGNNASQQTTVPTTAQSGVKAIEAGVGFGLALKEDCSVVAWGSNTSPGPPAQLNSPPTGLRDVKAISANNGGFSLALKEDDTVVAWGSNTSSGQQNSPPTGLSGVEAIAAGQNHSLALRGATPPAAVCSFDAEAGDREVSLSWDNPSTPDFKDVRILRSTSGAATGPEPNAEQTQVYEGSDELFTDTGLTNGTTYHYTIYARDDAGNFSPRRVASNVTPSGVAPTANAQSLEVAEDDKGGQITLSGSGASGSAPLGYKLTSLPTHGTLYKGEGTNEANRISTASAQTPYELGSGINRLTYVPEADYNGADGFDFKASDGTSDSNVAAVTIEVTPVNDAPSFAKGQDQEVNEEAGGQEVAGWASAISAGPNESGQNVSFVATNDNNSLFSAQPAVASNGTLTYTPAADKNGSATVTVKIRDDGGTPNEPDDDLASSEQTFKITVTAVDDDPIALNDHKTVAEDDAATTIDVLSNDTDLDGGAKSVQSVTQPARGTVTNGGADLTYRPNADYCNGGSPTDDFDYTLNGGSTARVAVTVTCVNDAPVAKDDSGATDEDTALNNINVLGNDTDVENDALSISSFDATSPEGGSVTRNADGTFNYTPKADFNGTDTFTYKAKDANAESNSAKVAIIVGAVNDAPIARDNTYTTDEDTPLTVAAPGLLGNDTDVENDMLRVVDDNATAADGISPVGGPADGTVTLNADGSFTYTPDANFNGSDSFTYRVCDNGNPEPKCSVETATVNVTINPINDAPVAVDDSLTTDEDTAGNGNVLTNDTDVDNAKASLTAELVSGPSAGRLTLDADGSFTYTPGKDFAGTDTFTYKAKDANAESNAATVTITVDAVNDSPVAVADEYTMSEDETLTVDKAADGVLNNDSDIDGDKLTTTLKSGPANGTVTLNADGTFTYKPNADFNGKDSFTYTVSDGNSGTADATVKVTIIAVNDAPVAVDDAAKTREDESVVIAVLANDTDAEALSAVELTQPANGTAELITSGDDKGKVRYTPKPNYNNTAQTTDNFTYKANDGTADSNVARVTIEVTPVNDAPVAVDDAYSVKEDGTLTVVPADGVLKNDSDADKDALTAAKVSGPGKGTLTLNADGSYTYTPNNNFFGTDSFTYKANDGTADSNVATVNITVTPVNDAPTVTLASGGSCSTSTTGVGGTMNLSLADVDSSGGLTLSATSSNPSLVPAANIKFGGSGANRTVSITPAAKKSGSATITVTASDGTGKSTTKIQVIVGTDKKETIPGTDGSDMIFGQNGDDTIDAGDGNDLVCGGNAGGVINGGAGYDTLDGGNGNDTLRGDAGKDIVRGSAGNDTLTGGSEADSLDGGSGTDVATDYNAAEGDTRTNIP